MAEKDSARAAIRAMAEKHLAAGDPLGWFEPVYAAAGGDAGAISWADLSPNPHLLTWLEKRPLAGGRALVVGCGLGDDAEELARRGMDVTAFDISPTAIEWCRKRFPASGVAYVVADLLELPGEWEGAFDLVFEAYTLQTLPAALRGPALRSMARSLKASGDVLVICRGREPEEPLGQVPWPLTRRELSELAEGAGLVQKTFEDFFDAETPPTRRFRVVYSGD